MRLLAWNCRGLGNPSAIYALSGLVRRYKPDLIFLSETKRRSNEMEGIKRRLGFLYGLSVDCIGRGGGLALMWNDEVRVHIQSYTNRHFDAWIQEDDNSEQWRFTGIYGNPETKLRHETWNLLRYLKGTSHLPWVCAGDFNEIISHEEKVGDAMRTEKQMEEFSAALDDCSLHELPVVGPMLAWTRKMEDELIMERLDRAVASQQWLDMFPFSREEHIVEAGLDHLPLIIVVEKEPKNVFCHNRLFHFENMWSREDDCKLVIESAWTNFPGNSVAAIADRLQGCANRLRQWDKTQLGNIRDTIQKTQKELTSALEMGYSSRETAGIKQLQAKFEELKKKEEVLWRQRAKQLWLVEGDRNTKYFHVMANARKRNNKITKLKDDGGRWTTQQKELEHVVALYFSSLFSTSADI